MFRKFAWITAVSFVAVMVVSVLISHTCIAEGKNYKMGYAAPFSPVQTTQFQHMLDEAFKILAAEEGIHIEGIHFKTGEELVEAARNGELDAVISFDHIFAYELSKVEGFSPMFTFSMYGIKTSKKCFYVKDDSGISKYSELKGKALATYTDSESYFLLRDLMGEAPEKYFDMVPASDGTSASYALAMDKADIIFISEYSVEYMKITNPGPAKSLLQLECSVPFVYPPMYASDEMPRQDYDMVLDLMTTLRNNPSFKTLRPAMKTVKMRLFPVTMEDYSEIFGVFEKAFKEGWDSDFEEWLATVEDAE